MDVKSVVLVGPTGAGKTCLAHALSGLSKAVVPTIGPELYALQRDTLVVHLWDTPGQGQFASVSAPLLDRAELILLCSCDGKYSDAGKRPFLKVRTKDDLGAPWFPADLATSAVTGAGIQHPDSATGGLLSSRIAKIAW